MTRRDAKLTTWLGRYIAGVVLLGALLALCSCASVPTEVAERIRLEAASLDRDLDQWDELSEGDRFLLLLESRIWAHEMAHALLGDPLPPDVAEILDEATGDEGSADPGVVTEPDAGDAARSRDE